MKRLLILPLVLALGAVPDPGAASILTNGNLDQTQSVEINPPAPGFFLPKPAGWVNEATRTITGPTEDDMSSEPWAGPAPTPVTADGSGLPGPDGCNGPDCGVFFKPFAGNFANGAITAHLYQDNPALAGITYTLTAWAGAEQNILVAAVELALEFLNAAAAVIGGSVLELLSEGLLDDNGQPFDYKQYTVQGVAPAGTAFVRARASMIDGQPNPQGGGQALLFDDFELTSNLRAAPEPAALGLLGLGLAGLGLITRRRRV